MGIENDLSELKTTWRIDVSLNWTWKTFWEQFEGFDTKRKTMAISRLLEGGWMRSLSAEGQFEVLRFAPREVLDYLYLMPDTFKPEIIKWSKRK